MSARPLLVSLHKWLSLGAVALWTLQAATGIFNVFHWELDDATVAGEHRPTDLESIERRLASFAPPGSGRRIESVWTSGGAPDRWDVEVSATPPDRGRVIRIDGAGTVLRTRLKGERFAAGGMVDTLVSLHYTLLAGETGRAIIGVSGLLLLSNLILGVSAAWPRGGRWRRALTPGSAGGGPARVYSWHRALGLWLAVPAMFLVSAGVLLAFEHTLEELLPVPAMEAPAEFPRGEHRIGMAAAVETALARFPEAALSSVVAFPSADDPVWMVRLRQPSEPRRVYGKTVVFVSAVDGHILADFDAVRGPRARRFLNALFAFHTGEMGGIAGRVAVLVIGIWLLSMITLGLILWSSRRRSRSSQALRP